MALIDALLKEWKKKTERKWDRFYVAIDLHDTIFRSNYNGLSVDVIPEAIPALKLLSKNPEICIILSTGSYAADIEKYIQHLNEHDINVDYVNENPEVPSNELSDFSKKYYFNLFFDDKAGFIDSDWKTVRDFFVQVK